MSDFIYTCRKKYWDECFLCYDRDTSVNFLRILLHQRPRAAQWIFKRQIYFHWFIHFPRVFFVLLVLPSIFFVTCNRKNYGSLQHILFIEVQNSWITHDRPQCITLCSKLASLLLNDSIPTHAEGIPSKCVCRGGRYIPTLQALSVKQSLYRKEQDLVEYWLSWYTPDGTVYLSALKS